ncbi:MAG: rhodanese-like domain-containing protein [Rhodospirillales bacterium]
MSTISAQIAAKDFKKLYDAKARDWALFDIREKGETVDGHIFGASTLPRRLVEFRIAELVPDRKTRIFIYGGGKDNRAELVLKTLHKIGYANAQEIAGGLPAWEAAGGEVWTGTNVPSKDFGEMIHVVEHVPSISVQKYAELLKEGKLITCDVRTPEEFLGGHLPGAVSCPSFDIALKAADLAKEYPIIIVNCAGRTRSIIGASSLVQLGFKNVYALENGTSGWLLEDGKLEKGEAAPVGAPSKESVAQAEAAAAKLGAAHGARHIDHAGFKKLLAARRDTNIYIFDVRPLKAYQEGHIDGTLSLPGGQAVQRTDDFVLVRDATVVLIDQNEARAMMTAYWYRRMGIANVFVLRGGVDAWTAAGEKLVAGRKHPQPLGIEEARKKVVKLKPQAIDKLIREHQCVVLDVGASLQYAAGHLPGANWRPRGWLESIIKDAASPNDEIVVTASEEGQSVFAAATLRDMGYAKVVVLEGGTKAWRDAGLPLEKGKPTEVFGGPDFWLPPYEQGREGMIRYLDWEIKLGHKYEKQGDHAGHGS